MAKSREEYNAYMAKYMKARIARRREQAIIQLGGCCVKCGSTDRLEFDHIIPGSADPRTRRGHGTMWTFSEKRFQAELVKCQLLCHEHHLEKTRECGETGGGHNKIDDHSTEAMYAKGCRCDPCRQAKHNARVRRGEIKIDAGSQSNIYGGKGRFGTVDHGGGKTGKRDCPCTLCKQKKAQYMAERNRKIKESS